MCRWLAYSGSPILLEELLHKPAHSLIDQSMHSRLGATTTNGDGFGVGWYLDGRPPWCSGPSGRPGATATLRELAGHIASPLFVARIRASTGTAVQQTNCHPSATAAGCGSTTASSATSQRSNGIWCWPWPHRCIRRSKDRPTPRSCSTWP